MRNDHDLSATSTAIRVGLARKNASQVALARHLQLSQTAIHRRMSGGVSWRIDELHTVADFLGVSVADLLGDDAPKASA